MTVKSGAIITVILLTSFTSIAIASPFRSFYPRYAPALTNLSQNVCNEMLVLNEGVNYSPNSAPSPPVPMEYCYAHENCMLDNLPVAYLANYQAASVIMGLTPTLLASLGPSVAETSLLSAHRPLLSFLISLGAPAVYPMRVFDFTDPYLVLRHKEHVLKLPLLGKMSAELCSMLEYALALAAAASIIFTSAQLGSKTVNVFACTNKTMPLVWTFVSVAIHVTAALGYKITLNSSNRCLSREHPPAIPEGSKTSAQKGVPGQISTLLQSEFRICAHRQQLLVHRLDGPNDLPGWGILLSCSAGLAGLCHVVYGTFVFSSLTFISVHDFLNVVFWRYIAAATVCKVIMMIELTGLRTVERRSEQQDSGEITRQSL